MREVEATEAYRIDNWLWAARFFKSRSLAAEAVPGGKVHLNGARVKPGKAVRAGDELRIGKGPYKWIVIVRGLEKHRGPASQAQLLYEETEESKQNREKVAGEFRALGPGPAEFKGRPTKKARRDLLRLTRHS